MRDPFNRVLNVLKAVYAPLERAETLFLQMNNLSTMLGQVCTSYLKAQKLYNGAQFSPKSSENCSHIQLVFNSYSNIRSVPK